MGGGESAVSGHARQEGRAVEGRRAIALTDDPIDRIVVVEGHEGKAPLLPGAAVGHDVDDLDLAKLREVVAQVGLLRVFLDAPNKDLLHGDVGTRPVRVL